MRRPRAVEHAVVAEGVGVLAALASDVAAVEHAVVAVGAGSRGPGGAEHGGAAERPGAGGHAGGAGEVVCG